MGSSEGFQMIHHIWKEVLDRQVDELDEFVVNGSDFPVGRRRGEDLRACNEVEAMHQYSLVQPCKELILHSVAPLRSCLHMQPTAEVLAGVFTTASAIVAHQLPHTPAPVPTSASPGSWACIADRCEAPCSALEGWPIVSALDNKHTPFQDVPPAFSSLVGMG